MVNNYYQPGPATPAVLKFVQALDAGAASKGVGRMVPVGKYNGRRQTAYKK
jgi:hypothetical protein